MTTLNRKVMPICFLLSHIKVGNYKQLKFLLLFELKSTPIYDTF